MPQSLNEFDLIKKYFQPLVDADGPALSLLSDTAQFTPNPGHNLVFTKDMMVEGVHFFADVDPKKLAKKLLRVNLSDLAAAGAKPRGYLLGFGGSDAVNAKWLAAFSAGLAEDQNDFGISLWGGDTVKTSGQIVLSLTAIGEVEWGKGLTRQGAKTGDGVYCTGIIGDGALGLMALKGELPKGISPKTLISRLEVPSPRIGLGQQLSGLASAMADVSDGLLADLGHIAMASGVGMEISAPYVPLSSNGKKFVKGKENGLQMLAAGGDDYELIFTAPSIHHKTLMELSQTSGIAITAIGRVCSGKGVKLLDGEGGEISVPEKGFKHF